MRKDHVGVYASTGTREVSCALQIVGINLKWY
jgi:hypothetical protein